MANIVLGIFSDRQKAEEAISNLQSMGYNPKDMSILMKDTEESKEMSDDTGVGDIAEGTVEGATTGAVAGGVAGFLAGTVLPGLGGFLIGGPIGAALGLSGAAASTVSGAATGAALGGILGALTSTFGLSEEEAQMYETRIQEGGILVAVPARVGEESEVRNAMEHYDANDIKMVEDTTRQSEAEDVDMSNQNEDSEEVMRGRNTNSGRQHDDGDDFANPIQVEKFLKGVDYPASKAELLDKAEEAGADDRVMATLEHLPNKKFDAPTEVSKAIGNFE